ncbi:MAG TPA: hypothetical protein VFS36_09010 [Chitinophagaceae bacterium]|jgi:hypothetical protein|nr:hypothetical protein [Chitinophagaceae bacterium]
MKTIKSKQILENQLTKQETMSKKLKPIVFVMPAQAVILAKK